MGRVASRGEPYATPEATPSGARTRSAPPSSGVVPTVDIPRRPNDLFEAPGCDFEIATLETFRSYELLTVTQEGIDPWLSGRRNVEARLSEVAGYPAATHWLRGAEGTNTSDCATSVDVAEGQQLMLTADNDAAHSYALDQLCQLAEKAAGMAVETLKTSK
jgi:hypothetical protein